MDILIPTVTCNCICTITVSFIDSTIPDVINVVRYIECKIPVMYRLDAGISKNKIYAFVIDPAGCNIRRNLIIEVRLNGVKCRCVDHIG